MKFKQWVNSIAHAGEKLLKGEQKWFSKQRESKPDIADICDKLLTSDGEALGTAIAALAIECWRNMDKTQRIDFYQLLVTRFSLPFKDVQQLVGIWQENPSTFNLHALHYGTEPKRLELFRRFNMAPNGTQSMVLMRAELLELVIEHPEFKDILIDLKHLMMSWFNRGFLQLVKIDWKTPAHILEKLIAFEAVHTMQGWSDLRRRLADDRRCFAFFHPAMEDEPLIFVQVALTQGIANSVQSIINDSVDTNMVEKADSAIFYSISDCQPGLKGISFGNFLIKQVVMELTEELPNLRNFATLSPIPGFKEWLHKRFDSGAVHVNGKYKHELKKLLSGELPSNTETKFVNSIIGLCAKYLIDEKRGQAPLDPVARFHLRNGASVERLNWLGDTSEKGIGQSLGLMVNYRYELSAVEARHEAIINRGEIALEKPFVDQTSPELLLRA